MSDLKLEILVISFPLPPKSSEFAYGLHQNAKREQRTVDMGRRLDAFNL